MLSRYLGLLLLGLAFNSSCQRNSNKERLLQYLKEDIEKASITINTSIQIILSEIEEKKNNPPTSTKGGIWLQKALAINQHSQNLFTEINELKTTNTSLLKIDKLNQRIRNYADTILAIDPKIRDNFKEYFVDTVPVHHSLPSLWERLNILNDVDDEDRIIILSQLQLGILQRARTIISLCNMSIPIPCSFYTSYSTIIGQNSQVITAGEKLEIVAGVGAFSSRVRPIITINGSVQEISEDGTAIFQYVPRGKPGNRRIPVSIEFLDEYGIAQKVEREVTYRLVKNIP